MELRRREPWIPVGRIPLFVIAGNQLPGWAPPDAPREEERSLVGLDETYVADHHRRIPMLRALRTAGRDVIHAAGPRACDLLIQKSTLEIAVLVCCADMKEMAGFELARLPGSPDG